MSKVKYFFLFFIILSLKIVNIYAINYKIAILAKDGKEKCLQDWRATGDYLNDKIPEHICEIIPLEYHMILPAIKNNEIDFIITNPIVHIIAKANYKTNEIATMVNNRDGIAVKEFGGVIFTTSDNEKINSLQDIKGKNFVAVSQNSLGGWLMAYKEFLDNGINPYKNFNKLSWVRKHEFAIMQVLIGEADAGTVRTDTIERMIKRGLVQMDQIKIINQKNFPNFPFLASTPLYPEWPISKLKKTDERLSKLVVKALKNMQPEDSAAKDAKIIGWIDPLDYAIVENLKETLKIGEYSTD